MNKIGIVTITDYNNYGNRLQNYAVQEILKPYGFQIETIVNQPPQFSERTNLNKLKEKSLLDIFKKIFSRINFEITRRYYKNIILQRIESFKRFTNKHITESDFQVNSENTVPIQEDEYDFFIVGSDQIWNPYFRGGFSFDFLEFTSKNKRIAFSPSFGISELPAEFVPKYKEWLLGFKYLSVRETAGASIIEKLTGRKAQVLIDPTLMLTKDKWLSISYPAKNKPENNYLLTYFLGEISLENRKEMKRIARENNLQIINLASLKDKSWYTTDPSEFIDYLNSATLFMTDSFHGVVFSILLEKPFIVFDRVDKTASMNSRIENLLDLFNMESRLQRNIKSDNQLFEVNFSHIAAILNKERTKTRNYIENALSISPAIY